MSEPGPCGGASVTFQPDRPSDVYAVNRSVSALAIEHTDCVFSHWTGDLAGSENRGAMLVSEDRWISAIFYPTVTAYCSPSDAGSDELAPQSSNNPKGRVPRACPWGNGNSPAGRQAKPVIKKRHEICPWVSTGSTAETEVDTSAEATKGYCFVTSEGGDASGSDRSITKAVDVQKTVTARSVGQSASH